MRHTGIKIFLLLLFLVIILCAIIVIRDPSILPFGGEREQASSAGLFGGEGLFNTLVTGPGRIVIQTMPRDKMAEALIPYIPVSGS